MGRNYWPVFIIVAALASAATWRFSPQFGRRMPKSFRDQNRMLVGAVMGRGVDPRAVSATELAAIKEIGREFDEEMAADEKAAAARPRAVRPGPAPRGLVRVQAPVAEAVSEPPPAVDTTKEIEAAWDPGDAAPASAAEKPVAVLEDAPENAIAAADPDDPTPAQKGVRAVSQMDADWAVLRQTTLVERLDGTPLGRVKGGRFFVIERRFNSDDGLMLIGNFTPKKLDAPVQIPALSVYGLTGSPDRLSAHQRDCLRKYYELRGAAIERKAELAASAAKASPYLKPAADALREFRERAKKAERAKDADVNRKAAYDLSALRARVQELNRKHKAWKERHAGEMADPEKDAAYAKILEEQKAYAASIAGLAF